MLLSPPTAQIRHRHNLNNQARPACKMLGSLPIARLRIVLFPCKACSLPFIEDILNKVLSKGSVNLGRLGFVWARLVCNVLANSQRIGAGTG